MVDYIRGSELSPRQQAEVKRAYIHRYTLDHKPNWVTWEPPHFASDQDWLENTFFPIKKDGELARRPSTCRSYPTWPKGLKPL